MIGGFPLFAYPLPMSLKLGFVRPSGLIGQKTQILNNEMKSFSPFSGVFNQ